MRAPSDTPRVMAPPPLIFFCGLASGFVLDAMAGYPGIAVWWPIRWLIGFGLIGCGVHVGRLAIAALRQAGTRIEPWRPTTTLVTTGIYARSRNPIYLAIALIQIGLVLILDSIFGLVTLVPVMMMIRYGVIDREERYLAAKFGARYRDYADHVRRWA